MSNFNSFINSFIFSILIRQGNTPAPTAVDIQAMIELFEMMMMSMDYTAKNIEDVYEIAIQNPDINEDIKTVIKKNITMNY
jgi:hypothetical protein